MRRIKGYWGGHRHDVVLRDTDEKFRKLITGLESLPGMRIKVRAKHDWGYGIPVQESGHDVRIKLFEKTGWFSKEEVADFELRLDQKKQSNGSIHHRGELPALLQDLATELGYDCHPTDNSFVSSKLF
jgi:hypothetical protein